jgi:hypothetical protein
MPAGGGAVFERRHARRAAEQRGQVFARAEPARLGHPRDREVGGGEEVLGPFEPHAEDVVHLAPHQKFEEFGGPDGRNLFITAGGTLYTARTATPGRVWWPKNQ